MSRAALLVEIERLRNELHLASSMADHTKLLKVSRKLDKLIVEFYRTAE